MVTHTVLPFKYQIEKRSSDFTSLAGLPIYMELGHATNLYRKISRYLHIRRHDQGFTDAQILSSLILLNIAGGESVSDLDRLRQDDGFRRLANEMAISRLGRKERRQIKRRWKNGEVPAIPSPSVVFRWLNEFHDKKQEKIREKTKGSAFIPAQNKHLKVMRLINRIMVEFIQKCDPSEIATLDMDATLIESSNRSALYCYKGFSGYQPLNTWWAEHEMVLHTEFRDGNVPAGFEQLRIFKESLALLPKGVKTVRLRSDSAGYQYDLMDYCQNPKNSDYELIEFAIACSVGNSFKTAALEISEADWHPIYKTIRKGTPSEETIKSGQEWAEICYVPTEVAKKPTGHVYRYLAIRESIQTELPGADEPKLPFPTYKTSRSRYKLFGMVTNMDWEGEKLIHWHRERCGRSEQAHSIMKTDFAGGQMPSDKFGVNAAWWWVTMIAMNLNTIMKKLVLGGEWKNKRMKAIRFHFISIPGRIMKSARQTLIRLSRGCQKVFDLFGLIREKMLLMLEVPG